MKPKDWVAGMMVGEPNCPQGWRWLLLRRSSVWIARVTAGPRDVGVITDMESDGELHRMITGLSYADLGTYEDRKNGDLCLAPNGSLVEVFRYPHGSSGMGNLNCYPLARAVYEAAQKGAQADDRKVCGNPDCQDRWKDPCSCPQKGAPVADDFTPSGSLSGQTMSDGEHTWTPAEKREITVKPLCDDGRDAGERCVRAVAAELEWEQDMWDFRMTDPQAWPQHSAMLDQIPLMQAILDKWGPRLSEFTDCGDCPPCEARTIRARAEAEKREQDRLHQPIKLRGVLPPKELM